MDTQPVEITQKEFDQEKVKKAQQQLRDRIKRYINKQDTRKKLKVQTPEEFIKYSNKEYKISKQKQKSREV